MSYLGPSDFARKVGVSRNSVYHAIKGGRLVKAKNGKLNLANPTNIVFMNLHKEGAVKLSKSGGNGSGGSRADAELAQIEARIEKLQVGTAKERQELVDRELVRSLLGHLATIDQNELLTIPANVAPEVAGLCGTDDSKVVLKVSKLIEKKLYGVLKHRARLLTDFLKAVKAKPLEPEKKNDRPKPAQKSVPKQKQNRKKNN